MPLYWANQAQLDARYVLRGAGSLPQDNVVIRPNSNGSVFTVQNAAGTSMFTANTSTGSLSINSNPTSMSVGQLRITRISPTTDTESITFAGGSTYSVSVGRIANSDNFVVGHDGGSGFVKQFQVDVSNNLRITNSAGTPPTPTGEGVLYVVNGALTYIGTSGTVTTIAPV